jgi:hypothetical protein
MIVPNWELIVGQPTGPLNGDISNVFQEKFQMRNG